MASLPSAPLSLSQHYCNLFDTRDSGVNFQIYTEKEIGIQYLSLLSSLVSKDDWLCMCIASHRTVCC